eukprot:6180934-Pleurochrysis_carterae.AAC.1
MDLTQATMTAVGAPSAFWEHAIIHATDILNRTSGPPKTAASSYELLTGEKPRVMSILPFGCRSFAGSRALLTSKLAWTLERGLALTWGEAHPHPALTTC